MYVKQGLKREETIENGHSQKALEYPLSTDVCAISKFVTRPKITLFRLKMLKRLWKGIGGPGKLLMGKRAMHKKVTQKYDIWLGEIKC